MKIFILGLFILSSQAFATRIDVTEVEALQELSFGEIRGCDARQSSQIKLADKAVGLKLLEWEAAWMLVDLLGVRRDYVTPQGRLWLDGNPRHATYQRYWLMMKETIRLMREASQKGVNFECRTVSDRNCGGDEVFAYVRFLFGRPKPMIYLCPSFYTSSSNSQAETVLHELSHYAASSEDFAGEWMAGERSDLLKAAKDAYHIQLFMLDEVPSILQRQIWAWWWPRAIHS